MKNITELRNSLASLYADIQRGEISVKQASEMNNTAGKIINTCKVQLEYQSYTKDKPAIPFLEK